MQTIEEKYHKYMENIKRANKKYIESHRDEINAKCRNYYRACLANNEEYKAKKREYNKQLYLKKKQNGQSQNLGKQES
jgi:hypothetical protein